MFGISLTWMNCFEFRLFAPASILKCKSKNDDQTQKFGCFVDMRFFGFISAVYSTRDAIHSFLHAGSFFDQVCNDVVQTRGQNKWLRQILIIQRAVFYNFCRCRKVWHCLSKHNLRKDWQLRYRWTKWSLTIFSDESKKNWSCSLRSKDTPLER